MSNEGHQDDASYEPQRTKPSGRAQVLMRRQRRAEVAKLYLRGITNQTELAKKFGLHKSQISRDLAWLNRKWENEHKEKIDKYKGRALAELEEVRRGS